MKTRDLSELAARNLREAVLRNSLTTLGVAVGVASLVAMLSLGVGLQTLASHVRRHAIFAARGGARQPIQLQNKNRVPWTRTPASNWQSSPT